MNNTVCSKSILKITFIAAHLAGINDLGKLGSLLDEMPNVVVEFGAVIAELGSSHGQQDNSLKNTRQIFGKDSWVPEEYNTYFRVLKQLMNIFRITKYHAFWRVWHGPARRYFEENIL